MYSRPLPYNEISGFEEICVRDSPPISRPFFAHSFNHLLKALTLQFKVAIETVALKVSVLGIRIPISLTFFMITCVTPLSLSSHRDYTFHIAYKLGSLQKLKKPQMILTSQYMTKCRS